LMQSASIARRRRARGENSKDSSARSPNLIIAEHIEARGNKWCRDIYLLALESSKDFEVVTLR
jgi:hypothetical protein